MSSVNTIDDEERLYEVDCEARRLPLKQKRQVVEILMCAAQYVDNDWRTLSTWSVPCNRDHTLTPEHHIANDLWFKAYNQLSDVNHSTVCLEAAYELIESSPALRKEWFRE